MQQKDGVNYKVWLVLQKLKKYYYQNTNTLNIKYIIYIFPINSNNLSSEEECFILKMLNKKGVLQIFQRKIINCTCITIYLKILQPYFHKLYQEYFFYYQNSKCKTDCEVKETSCPVNQRKKNAINTTAFLLRQELYILDIILKHYLKSGVIYHKDYRCLMTINSLLKKITNEATNNRIGDLVAEKKHQDTKTRNGHKGYSKFNKEHGKVQKILYKNSQENKETNGVKPLPITGKIEVSGLNESLKALRVKESITTEPKFPFKIPAGTHWNNVIIKFLDNEKVEIYVKKLKHTTNYKEMGMLGKGKVPEPSEQWLFMKVLAQCNGEIAIKDPEAKDKYKKQKQALTEILRNYFSIDYDPFYPYKSCLEKGGNSYKIKIMLIPPVVEKNIRPIITDEETDPLGIQEFLNNQMVNR
jgi:hypothetical protein